MAVASRSWLSGAELGHRFSAVRLLRAGSRFAVYEALDADTKRRVAIKLPGISSGSWLHEVLDTEARILAALGSHPHVLTCYEQIRLDDGRPAMLLERCVGTVYDSLHRGEPAARPPLHHLTPHTAPELLEGGEPTTATDVYGLASTLYELVAGRAAFRAYVGESPASVIVRLLSNPVLPIVSPDVPLEMSDLLTWGLSPDPANRPPTPSWVAEELGRIERREGWPRTRMVVG